MLAIQPILGWNCSKCAKMAEKGGDKSWRGEGSKSATYWAPQAQSWDWSIVPLRISRKGLWPVFIGGGRGWNGKHLDLGQGKGREETEEILEKRGKEMYRFQRSGFSSNWWMGKKRAETAAFIVIGQANVLLLSICLDHPNKKSHLQSDTERKGRKEKKSLEKTSSVAIICYLGSLQQSHQAGY